MSWSWFPRGPAGDRPRPSLQDVVFDLRGWSRRHKTADSIEWSDIDNDRLVIRIDRAPIGAGVALSLDAWRDRYRRAAAERDGGIVSVDFGRANGVPIVKAITKFLDRPAYVYEGTVSIVFRQALCEITIVATEHGMTGTREAIVTPLLLAAGVIKTPKVTPPAVSAPIEGWFGDPYDPLYAGSTQHTYSDDERLDALLPGHPLSKVRRWLASMESSLIVVPDLLQDVVEPPAEPDGPVPEPRGRMPPHTLGRLYFMAHRLADAEPLMFESIAMRDGTPILDAPDQCDRLNLLGIIRETLNRHDDAIWAHTWAERVSLATVGSEHPDTIRARGGLARIYAGLRRPADAEPLLAEILPRLEAANNEPELSLALNAFGLVRQAQERHGEAIACFDRALVIFEKLYGPNFIECATVLGSIARSADALGDRHTAKRAATRAWKIERERP